jgi:hypothetical protein
MILAGPADNQQRTPSDQAITGVHKTALQLIEFACDDDAVVFDPGHYQHTANDLEFDERPLAL